MSLNRKNPLGALVIFLILVAFAFWYSNSYFKLKTNPVQTQTAVTSTPTLKGEIFVQQNAFVPDSLTVKIGDTVTWVNNESYEHNIVGDNGSFKSPILATGDKYSFTFKKVGTYTYICSIHPFMHGTIIVIK
jgi:amicyanin